MSDCCGPFVPAGGGSGGGGADEFGVNVQDEGVAVPNNPHTTLNFVGAGVTATDAGAGVATITIPGAAGSAHDVLTYRPGSAAVGPNVFNDWDDLYAQLVALRTTADDSGRFTIVMDDSFDDPVVIPSNGNSYDMAFTEWIGVRWFAATEGAVPSAQQVDVVIGDGAGGDIDITTLIQVTGLSITTEQEVPPLVADELTLTLIGTLISGQESPTRTPLQIGNSTLRLGDESRLVGANGETPGPAAIFGGGSTVTVLLDGANASLGGWAIDNNGATYSITVQSSSATVEIDDQELLVPTPEWTTELFSRSGPFLPPTPVLSGVFSAASYVGYLVKMNLASTVTLPEAHDFEKGELIAFKNITTSKVITINRAGTDSIDGATSVAMVGDFAWLILQSDGLLTWNIVSQGNALSFGTVYSPPEKWHQENVAASQTNVALTSLVSINFDDIKMMRSGSIVGLSSRFTEALTLGQATITVTKNGAAGTLAVISTNASNQTGGQSTQAPGIDTYVAGDLIGIQITTNGAFAPTTSDVEAWLQLSE